MHLVKTELAELGSARGRATRMQSGLVKTVSAGGAPNSVVDAPRDVEAEIAGFDERAEHARSELQALDAAEVDADALRAALEEFNGVWDRLTLEERGRLLDLLLAQVTYDRRDESVEIAYRERRAVDREEAA